ncbi:MAG: Gfo/Idh/MocA family oxidoreductase [Pirellulales bacterium]
MRLRLGLIGLSRDWQNRYRPALRMLQDRFEVRGVYSSVSRLADSVAQEFGAERFDGYRSMLEREDIDAAMMLDGDWYGTLPIQAACDFGKAIYCGTEVDFKPQAAGALRQRVEESGIAFMAEFPRRYAPATLRLKELIATRLGRPRLLFCHRRLTCEVPGPGHRSQRSLADRSERELMELIDWCRFIVGHDPNTVQAVYHPSPSDAGIPDYQVLSVDFSSGPAPNQATLAQISCGAYMPSTWHEAITFRPPAGVQVCCENGLAFVDLPNSLIWFDEAGRHQESLDSELSVGQQLLTQFHRAVTSLVRKMGDLEDVYRSLRALEKAHESMNSGGRIAID